LYRHADFTISRFDLTGILGMHNMLFMKRIRHSRTLAGQKRNALLSPSVTTLPRLLNIREVAHVLGVSTRTVKRLLKNKQLTHYRVRGQLRFDPIHLDQYLQKRRLAAA
jgi:excisionase family DNA binding protein